jgi:hypothetical protein
MTEGPAQQFNDDLLVAEVDRRRAEERFPSIIHVLDFPDLRELFLAYELQGNRAKRRRRLIGLVAIALGALALLGASLTPLLYDPKHGLWAGVVGGVSASFGILSVLIGPVGILSGKSKQKWLCARLMTERLRQFQFQVMTYRPQEIRDSSTSGEAGRKRFVDQRKQWFAEFCLAYEGHLPARLQAILDDDPEEDFLLHHEPRRNGPLTAIEAELEPLFSAYRLFRLEHQLEYANYKLRRSEEFFSSAVRQFQVLRNVGLGLIALLFIAHFAIAASLPKGALVGSHKFHFGIAAIIVGILMVRALEEGLQPAREIERYTRYRASLVSLLGRFDRATTSEERLRVMYETERTSYQEMRGFLKTHNDARYVL